MKMPEAIETMMQEVDDLSKFASSEAVKRIMDIADVLDVNELKLMVGMRAARTLYVSFLLTAVEKGMPHCAAESYVADTIDKINKHIGELVEERKKGSSKDADT